VRLGHINAVDRIFKSLSTHVIHALYKRFGAVGVSEGNIVPASADVDSDRLGRDMHLQSQVREAVSTRQVELQDKLKATMKGLKIVGGLRSLSSDPCTESPARLDSEAKVEIIYRYLPHVRREHAYSAIIQLKEALQGNHAPPQERAYENAYMKLLKESRQEREEVGHYEGQHRLKMNLSKVEASI